MMLVAFNAWFVGRRPAGLGRVLAVASAILLAAGCAGTRPPSTPDPERLTTEAYAQVRAFLEACRPDRCGVKLGPDVEIDTLVLDLPTRHLDLSFNAAFAHIPFREETAAAVYAAVRSSLGPSFEEYGLTISALGLPIEELVPNYYRSAPAAYDRSRMPAPGPPEGPPVVLNLDRPVPATEGLAGRHIALWPSHGWYFEHALNRWEWQRARVFQTVEDLLPMAFVVPYLAPMLENAGAGVFLPRERDVQTHEVVVDNDTQVTSNEYIEQSRGVDNAWQEGGAPGFGIGSPPYEARENPFRQGTYRYAAASPSPTASIRWVPDVPADGDYAVYISYASPPDAATDARYTVYHKGGTTTFAVNQRMGGGTWIYLGTFTFGAGLQAERGQVVLTNQSAEAGRVVTADAVRFGGGMGNVARNGQVSGRPRFVEGARYYMQYAGMPDSLVYNVSDPEEDDYRDDYQGRGEWVNYLVGAPFGPNKDRATPGLGIPIDLSLAFHTDAGFTRNDTTIGTLMIYNSEGADGTTDFPDGMSRFANRDFGDLLQTQLVSDLRAAYDPAWNRRSIWDRPYSEAHRPNVPSALLELLSHHNFLDMKFALDPRFRFDVSRSIYKAILRFVATQHREPYTVQPLPVTHMQATFTGPRTVTLRWQPQPDPLEPTAEAVQYVVYARREGRGFDNGVVVDGTEFTIAGLDPDVIYSYKVTAVNAGGESFPSEILSVCYREGGAPPLLVVNGFDRVSAPATLEADGLLGFASFWDGGVPDRYDFSYVGDQYDFDAGSPWRDDDAPGHGASYADHEGTVIAGNTFDYPYRHGLSLRAAGQGFASASDEAVMEGRVPLSDYGVVDLILGEERETAWPRPVREPQFRAFPVAMQTALGRYVAQGGRLFISGAYLGTDLFTGRDDEHPDVAFAHGILRFSHRTNHAARTGRVASVDSTFFPLERSLQFNTASSPEIYAVEAPDGIEPADSTARTILRYAENNISAAVAHEGDARIVLFGFPFEAILTREDRDAVMEAVLRFLKGGGSAMVTH